MPSRSSGTTHLERIPELDLVGVRFVNLHVSRNVMTEAMINQFLVVLGQLELEQVLEVCGVLLLEFLDFLGETVDGLNGRCLGFAQLAQRFGPRRPWVGARSGLARMRRRTTGRRSLCWRGCIARNGRF